MSRPSRARAHSPGFAVFIAVGAVALLLSACAGAPSSPSVPAAASAAATSSPVAAATSSPALASPTLAAAPTETARRSASLAPSIEPTTRPSASATAQGTACAADPQITKLPSDRFTSVAITSGPNADLITFAFGNASLPGPPAPPVGSLERAKRPFTDAASGATIRLAGEHAIQTRFTNMSVQNDVGQPVYDGPAEYRPDLPALRHLVLFDMSEGVIGWYVGYDGTGCVKLARVRDSVTVTIAHK